MKYIFICSIAFLISCESPKKMSSVEVEKTTERIDNILQEVNAFSEIQDTEYDLFNVNGFSNGRTLVAGSSSLRYDFVVKIDTSDFHKWTEDMIVIAPDTYSLNRFEELVLKRKENWKVNSNPTYFKKGNSVIMMVYKEEGIIFKSIFMQ